MKQFLLPCAPDPAGRIVLGGKDFHYLARVRRLQPGDTLEALLPDEGGRVTVVLSALGRDRLELKVLEGWAKGRNDADEALRAPPGAAATSEGDRSCHIDLPSLFLFQALPKGTKMDLIVRQAAECAVKAIVPFVSRYSVPRPGSSGTKVERWERIIREARQQSNSPVDTRVYPPRTMDELFGLWGELQGTYGAMRGILLHQEELGGGSLHGYLGGDPPAVALAVGSEGGFSDGEVSRFMAEGFKPLWLGNTILRTETASLYVLGAVRSILLEKRAWKPRD